MTDEPSHSFGYDCLKPDNLCLLDSKTAMFVSGNLIHFLDLEVKSLSYMRSSTGGGIGHATVRRTLGYCGVSVKFMALPVDIGMN